MWAEEVHFTPLHLSLSWTTFLILYSYLHQYSCKFVHLIKSSAVCKIKSMPFLLAKFWIEHENLVSVNNVGGQLVDIF